MTTATIIFVCAALYAFYDYYKTQDSKDLAFAIILFIGAVSTFIQTLNDNEQADNIENLSKLDTSLSHHIDTLATIDTGLSSKANDLANQSLQISNQNKELIISVQNLTEQSKSLINAVNQKTSYEAAENLSTDALKMNFTKQFHDNDMATIKIGGTTATTFISWIKKGGSFVNVGGKDLFSAHFINNKIVISLNVYDLYGNLIAEIENNNWRPNKNFTGKFNYNDTSFEVINNQGEVAISVDFLSNNVIIVKGIFPLPKDNIIILAGEKLLTPSFDDSYSYYINSLEQANIKKIFVYTGKNWLHKRVN